MEELHGAGKPGKLLLATEPHEAKSHAATVHGWDTVFVLSFFTCKEKWPIYQLHKEGGWKLSQQVPNFS